MIAAVAVADRDRLAGASPDPGRGAGRAGRSPAGDLAVAAPGPARTRLGQARGHAHEPAARPPSGVRADEPAAAAGRVGSTTDEPGSPSRGPRRAAAAPPDRARHRTGAIRAARSRRRRVPAVGQARRGPARAPARRCCVVNGCEGEPMSTKDRLLMWCAPHLVLDGAVALADADRAHGADGLRRRARAQDRRVASRARSPSGRRHRRLAMRDPGDARADMSPARRPRSSIGMTMASPRRCRAGRGCPSADSAAGRRSSPTSRPSRTWR